MTTVQEMKDKINEEFICVLRKNHISNQIEIGYVEIINPFKFVVQRLASLCDKIDTSIPQVVNFIRSTKEFDQLTAHYRYCEFLDKAFQGFKVNNQDTIKDINQRFQIFSINKKENPETYNIEEAIETLKQEIKNNYILWCKAYSINKTYRLCHEDTSILTFSHRIDGWSNPIYELTPNFSVEIKTNFGYGSVSYFYTKLKYKNIEITPFSEWLDYEFARFSEIIRYTQTHILKNEYWLEAMEFSRDACNLSLTNEQKFVEKYVIDECEEMVSGLEEIFNKEHFTFKNRARYEYSVDKKGHVLVEFRGEKISGALDFISKILQFENIVSIKSFITRIEECNKRIQPILVEETRILKVKIDNLNYDKKELQPVYDKVVSTNNDYNKKKTKLQIEMISNGQLDTKWLDTNKLENEFILKNPEYPEFKDEYKRISDKYKILTEQIRNNTEVRNKIISYNDRIVKYFTK